MTIILTLVFCFRSNKICADVNYEFHFFHLLNQFVRFPASRKSTKDPRRTIWIRGLVASVFYDQNFHCCKPTRGIDTNAKGTCHSNIIIFACYFSKLQKVTQLQLLNYVSCVLINIVSCVFDTLVWCNTKVWCHCWRSGEWCIQNEIENCLMIVKFHLDESCHLLDAFRQKISNKMLSWCEFDWELMGTCRKITWFIVVLLRV